MTNPTQPDRMTADELRAEFVTLHAELADLRADLSAMRTGLQQAATTPAPSHDSPLEIVPMTKITRTRTSGKWYYKMLGGKYMKRGVTIWPEALEALALDPDAIQWKDDDSFTFEKPLLCSVQMREYTNEADETKLTPQKVIGKA